MVHYAFSPSARKLFCVCALFGVLLFAACSNNASDGQGAKLAPVRLSKAEQRTVPRVLEAVGNVDAHATVHVKSQVGGQIVDVPVSAGQEVVQGQLLFRLDPRPFDAAVAEAQARLAKNRALLEKARKDLARYTTLVKQDVISREAYDQVDTAEKTIRADIEQDQAAIQTAKLNREFSVIRAPITGKLGDILVRNGNVIKANDERTLVIINSLRPAEVRFSVAERYLPEILRLTQRGTLYVTVLPQGDTGPPIRGEVTAVDNEVDRTTGSIRLHALFPNLDNRLWPGQFVRVTIVLATLENAVVVPEKALQEGMNGRFVYRAEKAPDGRENVYIVDPVYVEAEAGPDGFMVITRGIRAGDTVVTDGQLGLSPRAFAQDMGQQ
ncbi:efflux RND transporter periplasmic adaptor subunit [Desulfovibrio sp. OttesenSCG-928-G15]|nr:efflux RND transporter periplasmic adaptor subunit [Desulfovibrio sp. OttesenSCG-928-G15]